jgi:hypothetical protein
LHTKPHVLAAHVAEPFIGAVHTLPHAPQCCASVARSEHDPVQFASPGAQPETHEYVPPAPIAHTGVMPEHVTPHPPQFIVVVMSVSHPFIAMPSQSWKPAAHVPIPHAVPVQPAVACGGATHGTQDPPQVVGELLDTHAPEHVWYPGLHMQPHVLPSHVAMPFEQVGHGAQALLHVAGSLLLTHVITALPAPHM